MVYQWTAALPSLCENIFLLLLQMNIIQMELLNADKKMPTLSVCLLYMTMCVFVGKESSSKKLGFFEPLALVRLLQVK